LIGQINKSFKLSDSLKE